MAHYFFFSRRFWVKEPRQFQEKKSAAITVYFYRSHASRGDLGTAPSLENNWFDRALFQVFSCKPTHWIATGVIFYFLLAPPREATHLTAKIVSTSASWADRCLDNTGIFQGFCQGPMARAGPGRTGSKTLKNCWAGPGRGL